MSKLADDLRAARALIDTPEKWGKGSGPQPPPTGLCVMGAVGGSSIGWQATDLLSEALQGRWAGRAIHMFNDDPNTTHADIMALFDRAIAAAEQQP